MNRFDALTPLADWMLEHIEWRERHLYRNTRNDRCQVRRHIECDPIGAVPIGSITAPVLREWIGRLLVKVPYRGLRGGAKRMSYRTVRAALCLVCVALTHAMEDGHIDANPAMGVRLPRAMLATSRHFQDGCLSPDEQRALLSVLDRMAEEDRERAPWRGPTLRAIVRIALGTGMRRGELLALEWEDVHLGDDAAPYICVRRGRAGKDATTKSGKPRNVPLFGMALSAMREWCERERQRFGGEPTGLVFRGRKKGSHPSWHLWTHSLWTNDHRNVPGFKRALLQAGIERRVRFHDLRHSCATSLIEGWWESDWGVPAWSKVAVQQLLGHQSIAMTERYEHSRGTVAFRAAASCRDPQASPVSPESTSPATSTSSSSSSTTTRSSSSPATTSANTQPEGATSALVRALAAATEAQRWDVVAELARALAAQGSKP